MVPAVVYFSLVLLFIFILLDIFYNIAAESLKRPHVRTPKKNLPPGPWKLPIFGNLHQLSCSLPHISLEILAKRYGPIMHFQLGRLKTVIISSKELAEDILKKEGITFAERPIPIASMNVETVSFFSPYNEKWREIRKIYVIELLSKKRVQSFKIFREFAVWDLVESISSSAATGKPFNFSEKISDFTYGLNYRIIFGKMRDNDDLLIPLLKRYVDVGSRLFFSEVVPSSVSLIYIWRLKSEYNDLEQKISSVLDDLIRDYRAERRARKTISPQIPGDGTLIGSLLQIQESGNEHFSVSDDDIKHIIKEVFGAGSDTTATTIEWAMSELIINPNIMDKAQNEVRKHLKGKKSIDEVDIEQLKYLKSIIKETLRFHPPVILLPRVTRQTCEISGYEIPEKTTIIINLWALSRNPNYWENPCEFKPERFQDFPVSFEGVDFEFIPFGAGRRMCPGVTFASAILELLLAQLLYHFDWKLPDGLTAETLGMSAVLGAVFKRKNDLHLIASPVQFG